MSGRDARLAGAILAWYRALGRVMPWRGRPDPWAVWVSEIMLQQTTVTAVAPRFGPFLERFPNVRALAAADEAEVLAAVSGLGYYRRFRALKRAAELLVSERDARIPDDEDELRELPGVGDYTAGAIAAIGFGRRAAAVDGNVQRVFSRLDAREGRQDGVRARRDIAARVLELMPAGAEGDFSQALFDLGREVCTPRSPRCEDCPAAADCRARALGRPEDFPERAPKAETLDVLVAQAFVRRDDRVLLLRRPADAARMPGFWELPEVWIAPADDPREALARELVARCGLVLEDLDEIARARHAITRHRLDCRLFAVRVTGRARRGEDLLWLPADELGRDDRAFSTISRKLIARRN
ncbi:MAG: A/G-specific adenine glycosylase [Planctomycetota bacterium]